MRNDKNIFMDTLFYAFYSPGHRRISQYYGLIKHAVTVQVLKT